jgi:ABC-type multidrug transport system fused ATPase/permease subunit
MQKIFREKFKSQTMIVIAHKLHTILDFDRVAVLDKGRLVEYDAPEQLLARDSSAFKTLYESSLHGDTDALQPPVDS